MGIQDRDYYRRHPRASEQLLAWKDTAVGVLIALNAVLFIVQLMSPDAATDFLAARPADVFSGHVWKLLTANFAHSTANAWHIIGNMFFLYFLGREVERIYGRRDFFILYLSAGVLAILAEVTLLHFRGHDGTQVLGASGAVMAVVVLCALFYPNKVIYFAFFLPAPLWLLCSMYILFDILGMVSQGNGVANFAHLTGAAVGVAYRFLDLRTTRLTGSLHLPRRARKAAGVAKVLDFPRPDRTGGAPREADPIYRRVDQLLQKISSSGMDSLTGEELDFLKANSGRFRRDG
jgi:membrane associated rhomboid family serine protease